MSNTGSFKVAIIGAGGISNAHSGAIKQSGGRVELTAAIDMSNEAARTLASSHPGAQAFGGVDAFLDALDEGSVEAHGVVIATPPSARITIVEACLKMGLHVLSEKPLAHTLADAKKIASIAKKHKKARMFVAYCHRFTPAVVRMMELVDQGKIGSLVRWENAFACDLPGHKDKWFSDPKKAGGGAYLDMGSHSIDLFHFMVGASATSAAVFSHKWKGRTETAATVLVESTKAASINGAAMKNNKPGVAGQIISGWAETSRFTVAVVGDQGMLFYDYEQPANIVFKDLLGKVELHAIEDHGVRFAKQMLAFAEASMGKAKSAGKAKKPALASVDDGVLAAAAHAAAVKLAK
jgi:predicted dehydrogenase